MLATTIVLYLTCILFIGFGVGANFITIQGCLNQCSAKNKSVVTGTYSLFYTIGFGAGSILGNYLYSCIREKAFLVTLGLMALDVVLIALFRVTIQYEEKNRKRLEFRTIGIMVTGGALYGYIENTCTTFLPIYSRDNMPEKWRGFLLAGFVIGGLIAIIPLSDIAEKIGVYRANLVYCLLGAVGLAGVAITDYKILFAVVAGAFVCVLYPVTLAGLNHLNLNKEQVLCATGIYTLFYSAGSTLGPCSAGVSIKLLGNNGLFYICTGCLAFYFMCNAFKLFISTENGVL
jgi:MFS family permease